MHAFPFWQGWHGRGSCGGEGAGCGPHGGGSWHGRGHPFGGHGGGGADDVGGAGFGVRRPLRFLAHRLDLDDAQIADLAAILEDLKTERAQAAVDDRRAISSIADAVAGEALDAAKVASATGDRVKSAERVQAAVAKAVGRIHALLKGEQRAQLAYLLRTGTLGI